MKHHALIPLLITSALLTGCAGGTAEISTETMHATTVTTTSSAETDPPVSSLIYSETSSETTDKNEIVWSTDAFDSGSSERFYILGNSKYIGSLWFENSDGAEQIMSDYWYSEPVVCESDGVKILITDECYVTSSISHAFTVIDGEPVVIPINGFAAMRLTPDENGGFTALSSEYEGYMGHTWKPYWYIFSAEDMAFIPLGGVAADKNTLPQDITDRIAQDDGKVSEVIAFDNGITAVNYITEEYGTEFQFHRLYDNGEDITPDDNRGHYQLPQ